jgi:hypothetical protein
MYRGEQYFTRNNLHTTERREANWTGHILRRNFILKHVNDGKI